MWFRLSIFPGKLDFVGLVGCDGHLYWRAIDIAYFLQCEGSPHVQARAHSTRNNWDVIPVILWEDSPKTPILSCKELECWLGNETYQHFCDTFQMGKMETNPDPHLTFDHKKAPLVKFSSEGSYSFQKWMLNFQQDVLGFYLVIRKLDVEKYLLKLKNNCLKKHREMKFFNRSLPKMHRNDQ